MVMEPGGGNMAPLAQAWKNSEREGSDFLSQWLRAAQGTVICVLKKEKRKIDTVLSPSLIHSVHTHLWSHM